MESAALPRWIHRSAWLLACGWPLSLHAAILLGKSDWAPRLTVLVAVLGLVLWALATRRAHAAFVSGVIAALLGILMVTAPEVLLYAPPVLINAALAVVFGMSLRAPRVPVISVFARLEQGILPPDLAYYTRWLTWIWTVFFAAMAAIAVVLASFGSLDAWSTFSNIINYVLVGLLFVGEYFYRRRRFRAYRHATLMELVQNVRRTGLFALQRPAP